MGGNGIGLDFKRGKRFETTSLPRKKYKSPSRTWKGQCIIIHSQTNGQFFQRVKKALKVGTESLLMGMPERNENARPLKTCSQKTAIAVSVYLVLKQSEALTCVLPWVNLENIVIRKIIPAFSYLEKGNRRGNHQSSVRHVWLWLELPMITMLFKGETVYFKWMNFFITSHWLKIKRKLQWLLVTRCLIFPETIQTKPALWSQDYLRLQRATRCLP